MELDEIKELSKKPDVDKKNLLDQLEKLKEKYLNDSADSSLSEIEAVENSIKSDMSFFDNNPNDDHTPVMPDNLLHNYKKDKNNMRYIDEKNGNTVQYSVGNNGHSYGLKTRDKNDKYREPTKEEIEALADISGFKEVRISLGFSSETLALMKEVCKEKGITILNIDKIDEKIRINEDNKAKNNKENKANNAKENETKNRTEERLSRLDIKFKNDLKKLEQIPNKRKREALRRVLCARYSAARNRIISQATNKNKKQNTPNNNRQINLPPRDNQNSM